MWQFGAVGFRGISLSKGLRTNTVRLKMETLWIIVFLILAYLALELFSSLSSGIFLIYVVYRFIGSKLRGSKCIGIPDELQMPLANGLIRVGSELLVGYEHEWEGGNVIRFAISPEIVREELGTSLRVDWIGRYLMELRK